MSGLTPRSTTTVSGEAPQKKLEVQESDDMVRTLTYRATRRERLGLYEGLPRSRYNLRFPELRRRIDVEAMPISDDAFYIPPSSEAYTGGESVRAKEGAENVVQEGDMFNIKFMGLSVSRKDFFGERNELLMYSLKQGDGEDDEDRVRELTRDQNLFGEEDQAEQGKPGGGNQEEDEKQTAQGLHARGMAPTGLKGNDEVKIHYDPLLDGHNEGTRPNVYVEIGAGKTMYLTGDGSEDEVRIRFSVVELDRVSDLQARAISGIDQVGSYVSDSAALVPYGDLVANTFSIASELGRRGLKKYSKPDHVMTKDFGLAIGGSGIVLRYGYYVFLSEGVRGRVYLQTGGGRMGVYWKRIGATGRDVEYVPVSGISYVVMKVGKEGGCVTGCRKGDGKRLENILRTNNAIEMVLRGLERRGIRASVMNDRKKSDL